MPDNIDLYDHAYENYKQDAYRQIRAETYGHDLGQTSWVTSEESSHIAGLLTIGTASKVLEIGFGSGRYALHVAETTGCRLTGVDVNAHGVRSAQQLARESNREARVDFQEHDAAEPLPFADATFDAVFSNDAFCHINGRALVLREACRVLRPKGRLLFSDALVIGGLITNQEIATRSSIGFYVFTVPGLNEQLLDAAGFEVTQAMDTTENAATIAKRWHDARETRGVELRAAEGSRDYEGLQCFLKCVHKLASERRVQRWLYLGVKR